MVRINNCLTCCAPGICCFMQHHTFIMVYRKRSFALWRSTPPPCSTFIDCTNNFCGKIVITGWIIKERYNIRGCESGRQAGRSTCTKPKGRNKNNNLAKWKLWAIYDFLEMYLINHGDALHSSFAKSNWQCAVQEGIEKSMNYTSCLQGVVRVVVSECGRSGVAISLPILL